MLTITIDAIHTIHAIDDYKMTIDAIHAIDDY